MNPFRTYEVQHSGDRAGGPGSLSALPALERHIRAIWIGGVVLLPLVLWADGRLLAGILAWRTAGLSRLMEGATVLGLGGVDIGMLAGLAFLGWWRKDRELGVRGLVGAATTS